MARQAAESRPFLRDINWLVDSRKRHPISDHDGRCWGEWAAFRADLRYRQFRAPNCLASQSPFGALKTQPSTHTIPNSRRDVLNVAQDVVCVTGRRLLTAPLLAKVRTTFRCGGSLPQDLCRGDLYSFASICCFTSRCRVDRGQGITHADHLSRKNINKFR